MSWLIMVHLFQPVQTDFTNVPLETVAPPKKKREPRRILHFSDGILEEYSTDEEDEGPPPPPPVDPVGFSKTNFGQHSNF